MEQTSFFGVPTLDGKFVRQSDIAKLPFFDFWQASARGSTCLSAEDGDVLVFLNDWEAFCQLFIGVASENGK